MPEETPPEGQLNLANFPMPQFYANSFFNSMSATEISTGFLFGPRPLVMVSMPFSLAKSYIRALQELIAAHEQQTGTKVEFLEELMAKMPK